MESYFSDKSRLSAKREAIEDEEEDSPTELCTIDNSYGFATIFHDKLSVKYAGLSLHDDDVGVVQANHPAPSECLAYYFEINVKNAGVKREIAFGFSKQHVEKSGLKIEGCSYHGYDGRVCRRKEEVENRYKCQTYTTGDTLGIGINYASQQFFFTKNGFSLGIIPKDITGPLYPTVTVHSLNEEVTVNFGREAFAFDFKEYEASERNKQKMEIDSIVISPSISHELVKTYLLHYGYKETLKAFDPATEIAVPPADIGQEAYALHFRENLRELIMKGEIGEALFKLKDSYPQVVENDRSEICFLLGCQKFIEFVRKEELVEAVKCGREELAKFIGLAPFEDIVEDCVALLVYKQPEESTVGYFLGEMQKEVVGDAVNAAILSTNPNMNDELHSRMEKLVRHLTNCSKELQSVKVHQGKAFSLHQFLNNKC